MPVNLTRKARMNKADQQVQAIEEYINAASDYHEALMLVEESRQRVIAAIESNVAAGLSKTDPLMVLRKEQTPTEAVSSKITTNGHVTGSIARTVVSRAKRISRNSPGVTQKAVYEALPGDVRAIVRRTNFTSGQVHAATADLVSAGMAERHGTRGNYTYVVAGDKVNWTVKQFVAICNSKKQPTN